MQLIIYQKMVNMLERIKRWFDTREKSGDKTSEAYEKWVKKTPEGKGKIYEKYAYRIPELPEKKVTYTVSELLNGKTKEGKKLPKALMEERENILRSLYTGSIEKFDKDIFEMNVYGDLNTGERSTHHHELLEPCGIKVGDGGIIYMVYERRFVTPADTLYERKYTPANRWYSGEDQGVRVIEIDGKKYITGDIEYKGKLIPIAIPCSTKKEDDEDDTNIKGIIVGKKGMEYTTDIEGIYKACEDYIASLRSIS